MLLRRIAVLLVLGLTACNRAYQERPDGWITTKIQAQYFLDRDVKARNIEITAANGTVTLSGYVDSEQARQRAVDIARNTEGVRRIEDRLQLGPGPARAVGTSGQDSAAVDAGLTLAIQSRYFLDSQVKGRHINVDTSDGLVTLTGTVDSDAERQRAVDIARKTNGVRDVVDRLRVSGGR